MRRMLLPSGAIEQVARGDVRGVAPQHRRTFAGNFSLLDPPLTSLFGRLRRREAQDRERKQNRKSLHLVEHTNCSITPLRKGHQSGCQHAWIASSLVKFCGSEASLTLWGDP